MSEWREVRLGDIADIQTGPFGSQLHKEDYVTNGTPIVTVEHLGNKEFTTQNLPCVKDEDKKRLSKYVLRTGDIVFSRVGSVDRCSFVTEDTNGWMFSGRCLRVRPYDIDPEYLYYYFTLNTTKKKVRSIAVGTTMPSINTTLLSNILISFPTNNEIQRRIASILSALDDKIAVNRKICENLEAQAQALFKHWFIDFAPFKEGKFVESELGMIPEGWKVATIGDVCKCELGGTPSRANKSYWGGNIAWINSGEVNKFRICQASEYITEEGLNRSATKLLPAKTTVLAITGATLGQISLLEIDSCANQSVVGIKENKQIPYTFIFPLIKSKTKELIQMQTGGAQQHINKDNIQSLKIVLCPEHIMSKYNSITQELYGQIGNLCFENIRLSSLRDTLLPKLMSGEIKL